MKANGCLSRSVVKCIASCTGMMLSISMHRCLTTLSDKIRLSVACARKVSKCVNYRWPTIEMEMQKVDKD